MALQKLDDKYASNASKALGGGKSMVNLDKPFPDNHHTKESTPSRTDRTNSKSAQQTLTSRLASSRSGLAQKQHQQYQNDQHLKSLLNFESKLEKDLQGTTASLIAHLKSHSLLSSQNIPLMLPIENHLHECLQKTKTSEIPENKNYFAMSLKLFFRSLTEDELEFMCHNYVHNWINAEL